MPNRGADPPENLEKGLALTETETDTTPSCAVAQNKYSAEFQVVGMSAVLIPSLVQLTNSIQVEIATWDQEQLNKQFTLQNLLVKVKSQNS